MKGALELIAFLNLPNIKNKVLNMHIGVSSHPADDRTQIIDLFQIVLSNFFEISIEESTSLSLYLGEFLDRYCVDSDDTHENEDGLSEASFCTAIDHSDTEADISTMTSDDLYENWIKNTIQTLAGLGNLQDITACQIQQSNTFSSLAKNIVGSVGTNFVGNNSTMYLSVLKDSCPYLANMIAILATAYGPYLGSQIATFNIPEYMSNNQLDADPLKSAQLAYYAQWMSTHAKGLAGETIEPINPLLSQFWSITGQLASDNIKNDSLSTRMATAIVELLEITEEECNSDQGGRQKLIREIAVMVPDSVGSYLLTPYTNLIFPLLKVIIFAADHNKPNYPNWWLILQPSGREKVLRALIDELIYSKPISVKKYLQFRQPLEEPVRALCYTGVNTLCVSELQNFIGALDNELLELLIPHEGIYESQHTKGIENIKKVLIQSNTPIKYKTLTQFIIHLFQHGKGSFHLEHIYFQLLQSNGFKEENGDINRPLQTSLTDTHIRSLQGVQDQSNFWDLLSLIIVSPITKIFFISSIDSLMEAINSDFKVPYEIRKSLIDPSPIDDSETDTTSDSQSDDISPSGINHTHENISVFLSSVIDILGRLTTYYVSKIDPSFDSQNVSLWVKLEMICEYIANQRQEHTPQHITRSAKTIYPLIIGYNKIFTDEKTPSKTHPESLYTITFNSYSNIYYVLLTVTVMLIVALLLTLHSIDTFFLFSGLISSLYITWALLKQCHFDRFYLNNFEMANQNNILSENIFYNTFTTNTSQLFSTITAAIYSVCLNAAFAFPIFAYYFNAFNPLMVLIPVLTLALLLIAHPVALKECEPQDNEIIRAPSL